MIMPLDWNLNYFSLTGYASVLAWSGCLILLVLHFFFKPRQTVCHSALAIVLVAFALAKYNSLAYVNKIQPDLSQQKAELEAKIAAKQQEVLDDRGTQVAQIQFAEDGRDEFLDRAGLDDEDLETIDRKSAKSLRLSGNRRRKLDPVPPRILKAKAWIHLWLRNPSKMSRSLCLKLI